MKILKNMMYSIITPVMNHQDNVVQLQTVILQQQIQILSRNNIIAQQRERITQLSQYFGPNLPPSLHNDNRL